jgi:hypothetical protein
MPDEVITDHASQNSGRARALPLFVWSVMRLD